MKVALLTRHAVPNYGSLLQSIATQQLIEEMGHECLVIDYLRKDEDYLNREITLLNNKTDWNNNKLKKMFYLSVRMPESVISGIFFKNWRKKYLKLTNRYYSKNELVKNPPKVDVFLTGSDQVWGKTETGEYDDVYCLSFTNKKKISYASSFGNVNNQDNIIKFFKDNLSDYSHVLVREDFAVQYLKKIGIKSKQVLDPTLMFDSNFWDDYTEPIKEKNYILIYQLHNSEKFNEFVQIVACKENKKIIRISPSLHQITRKGKFVFLPSLKKFLSYIKYSDLFITDSFHGTAFAINFKTQFLEILPNNKTEERNKNILKSLGLSNRIVSDLNEYDCIPKIDYNLVSDKLNKLRIKSYEELNNAI